MDQQAEKDKTERVTGLGRRTREEIAKWNQMTALRFQTGGRHQTSPASLRGVYSVVLFSILLRIAKYSAIRYTVQYSAILCSVVQCNAVLYTAPPKEGRGCLMSPPCLES